MGSNTDGISNGESSSNPTTPSFDSKSDMSDMNINRLDLSTNRPLSSQLPEHILRRLTPLKRSTSKKSPSSSSPEHKRPKSLSATQVLQKVEQLKHDDMIKREQKKKELEEKQLSAEKSRKDLIAKRSENATKFINNKLIFGVHKVKFNDIADVINDETNDVDISKDTQVDNDEECQAEHKPLTKSDLEEIKYANTIKKAIKWKHAKKLQSSFKFNPLIMLYLGHPEYHKPLNKGWDFTKHSIMDPNFQSWLKSILNCLEIPDYDDYTGVNSTLNTVVTALFIYWNHYCCFVVSKGHSPETCLDILSTRLGYYATSEYGGYDFPDFVDSFYYNDCFSKFIIESVVMASEVLLRKLINVLKLETVPTILNAQRSEFFKEFKTFTNIMFVFKDDHSIRLLMLQMKIQDNLISSLAIQDHISDTSDTIHKTMLSEIENTTNLLRAYKSDSGRQITKMKQSFLRYLNIFKSEKFQWLQCGNDLKNSRLSFFEKFKSELTLRDSFGSKIEIPFFFTPYSWIEFQYRLLNEAYDLEVKKSRENLVPGRLRTGLRIRSLYTGRDIDPEFELVEGPAQEKLLEKWSAWDQNDSNSNGNKTFIIEFLLEIKANKSWCGPVYDDEKLCYKEPRSFSISDDMTDDYKDLGLRDGSYSFETLRELSSDSLAYLLFRHLLKEFEFYFIRSTNPAVTELSELIDEMETYDWSLEDWEAKEFDDDQLKKLMRTALKTIYTSQYFTAHKAVRPFLPRLYGGTSGSKLNIFTYSAFYMRKSDHMLTASSRANIETEDLRDLLRCFKRETLKVFPRIDFKDQSYRQHIIEMFLKIVTAKVLSHELDFAGKYPVSSITIVENQLNHLVRRLKVLLQVMFVLYFTAFFLRSCPILFLNQHFEIKEKMQTISPDFAALSDSLYDYFEKMDRIHAQFLVDENTCNEIVGIIKTFVLKRIEKTPGLAFKCGCTDEASDHERSIIIANFVQKNITENGFLKSCMMKCCYVESLGARIMSLVFREAGYEMEYKHHDSTKLFKGKCEGIADRLLYEFKRLIDVNIEVYDEFYKTACADLS